MLSADAGLPFRYYLMMKKQNDLDDIMLVSDWFFFASFKFLSFIWGICSSDAICQ